jgi:phosphoserine phosphatase
MSSAGAATATDSYTQAGLDARSRRMHVFDMDGTLLIGSSTIELARHFGSEHVGRAIEDRWLAGDITDHEFWMTVLDLCRSASAADLDAAFANANWMTGVSEVFQDIRERGEISIVITQSPLFFARRLKDWGVHETYGSDVEIGRPLSPTPTLSARAKVSITAAALERYGITPESCVAYGDSSSDAELFAWLPNTVGVNPSASISSLASEIYVGTSIVEACKLGRSLIGEASNSKSDQ